ncbi:MAG: VOC family protein [Fimbriimonadales bacterium]|nr:VOC family protein [Fimbriimonadales bacterium]
MACSLCHLILDVHDLAASLEFYHGLLGLSVSRQEDFDGHRLAYLETGSCELLLVQQPKEDQNPLLERSGGLVINFHVEDLPSIAEQVRRHGFTVLRQLEMALWGERTLLVADPDGYAVLLSEPVGKSRTDL